MSQHAPHPGNCCQVHRRSFLSLPFAAAALGLFFGSRGASHSVADSLSREERDKLSAQEIVAIMKQGNERFRQGQVTARNLLAEQRASAAGQFPAAMILSCIDSRAPAELIMDLGIANVFNARIAGNISNPDIVGSMEFACKVAGAKVVMVMGHTACGAVAGAIDHVELGNLTGLLAKIQPAVKATQFDGERTSKNAAFVNAVARKNVELTKAQLLETSPILRQLAASKAIEVVGTMYNLESGVVEFFA